ncbi:MAG: radical SAM protein, partial [Anaerolineae bacterium]
MKPLTPQVRAPAYLALVASGELERRARAAWEGLHACCLCPRACGVDRLAGQTGVCRVGAEPVIGSWNVHFGEEPPISGSSGSGTIFFSGCTGRCLFCQNYPISQLGVGKPVTVQRLAGIMLELQRRGCHNVNLVTPTHFVPAILRATAVAAREGLRLPLVYNTSGYDSLETLALLDGVVDV